MLWPKSHKGADHPSGSDESGNRRHNHRAEITIPGRFLTPDGAEHPCSVRDFSLNGIGFHCADKIVRRGQHIIAYVDDLGRFEGPVTRTFNGGFAIRMALQAPRQERVAAKIQKHYGVAEATQVTGQTQGSQFKLEDGTVGPCKIIHISFGGAQIATLLRPAIGSAIMLGRMSGKVQHYTPDGISIIFNNTPQSAAPIPPRFRHPPFRSGT